MNIQYPTLEITEGTLICGVGAGVAGRIEKHLMMQCTVGKKEAGVLVALSTKG